MGLLTVQNVKVSQVLHVRPSIVWMVRSSMDFLSSSMDCAYGRPHYCPSMDNDHGRPHYCPWETLLFMNHIFLQEHFLVSLGGS